MEYILLLVVLISTVFILRSFRLSRKLKNCLKERDALIRNKSYVFTFANDAIVKSQTKELKEYKDTFGELDKWVR